MRTKRGGGGAAVEGSGAAAPFDRRSPTTSLRSAPGGRFLAGLLLVVAAGALLLTQLGLAAPAGGRVAALLPWNSASRQEYRSAVVDLLNRADATLVEGSTLLDRHDADPRLGTDPAWMAAHQKVVDALAADYQEAQALQPDPGDAALQSCLDDSLRLIWIGHAMLHQAFQIDGHGAYYNSAHGNWDLNLGVIRLKSCRGLMQ